MKGLSSYFFVVFGGGKWYDRKWRGVKKFGRMKIDGEA